MSKGTSALNSPKVLCRVNMPILYQTPVWPRKDGWTRTGYGHPSSSSTNDTPNGPGAETRRGTVSLAIDFCHKCKNCRELV
jgi:hypothetical protein